MTAPTNRRPVSPPADAEALLTDALDRAFACQEREASTPEMKAYADRVFAAQSAVHRGDPAGFDMLRALLDEPDPTGVGGQNYGVARDAARETLEEYRKAQRRAKAARKADQDSR